MLRRVRPHQPDETPRFRLRALRAGDHTHLLFFEIDRLIADDISRRILLDSLTDAYTALVAGKRPDATPDRSFRQFAAREQLSAQAPLPPAWIALAERMTCLESHADTPLPTLVPPEQNLDQGVDEHTQPLAPDIPTRIHDTAARLGIQPLVVWLTAIATVLSDTTDDAARLYLYPHNRTSENRRSVGWYSGRSVLQVPAPDGQPPADLLLRVNSLLTEAGPAQVAWTERVHEISGANSNSPKRPSVAVIHTHQPLPQLHLPGTSVRSLTTGPGLDLAAGRIVYLINGDDLSLIVRFEKGRFAKELIVDLAQSTADHLIGLLDLP